MTATFSTTLRRTLEQAMATSRMKGIAAGFARGEQAAEFLFLGTDATARPLAEDSLFPVASMTKLSTALAVLRLVDGGILQLDEPLARYIPEAVAAADYRVTPRRLLSHIAGLPMDLPRGSAPYAPGLTWPVLAAACLQTPLEQPPGLRVQYSNVGYGLLAALLERETGEPFPAALQRLVLQPLGIEGYLGTPPPRPAVVLDGVKGRHAHTDLEPFNSPFWRSLALPWGGLLSTAAGALTLVRAFRGFPSGFLQPETAAESTRNQVGELAGGFLQPLLWPRCPWGLGPELRNEKSPHWTPAQAGPDSFGHSGASGCVGWCDPRADTAWVFLGSRTAESGWLIRQGPALGAAILREAG